MSKASRGDPLRVRQAPADSDGTSSREAPAEQFLHSATASFVVALGCWHRKRGLRPFRVDAELLRTGLPPAVPVRSLLGGTHRSMG